MPDVTETVAVVLRLAALVREEDGVWVAGCRSLDLYSQGDTAEEAKGNLREAVELWIDSCVERNTLGKALRELGWFRIQPGAIPPDGADLLGVRVLEDDSAEGDPFPLELEIPAYQAAIFSGTSARAAC